MKKEFINKASKSAKPRPTCWLQNAIAAIVAAGTTHYAVIGLLQSESLYCLLAANYFLCCTPNFFLGIFHFSQKQTMQLG